MDSLNVFKPNNIYICYNGLFHDYNQIYKYNKSKRSVSSFLLEKASKISSFLLEKSSKISSFLLEKSSKVSSFCSAFSFYHVIDVALLV